MFKNLLGTLLFFAIASFSAAGWAQVIGYVHEVKGNLALRESGKEPVLAKAGDTFSQGAHFITGAKGEAALRFEDGQVIVLAPNTSFIATTYVFNKAKVADSNIALNLVRGGMRFVSGMIATTNREKFVIKTPTATAGVRGTEGSIAYNDPDDPQAPFDIDDPGNTNQGQQRQGVGRIMIPIGFSPLLFIPRINPPSRFATMMASTNTGAVTLTVNGVTVTIPSGSSSISVSGSPPSQPTPTGSTPVPAVLQQVVALVRAIALANPANTPVNSVAVAAAVRAAVAAAAAPGNLTLQAAAQAALLAATNANQAVLQQALAGGGVPPVPATGTTPPPPLTQQELQTILTLPSGS